MNKAKRTAVIAGNWKMNNAPAQTTALINEMKPLVKDADCKVVLCVPFVDIPAAVEAAKGSNIEIGAENVHFKANGAYTGEISAEMLCEEGVEYVVIGHSERRQYFAETDQTVNLRTLAGTPFREAYKQVGIEVNERRFNYSKGEVSSLKASDLGHTHLGSVGNLSNDHIEKLMQTASNW